MLDGVCRPMTGGEATIKLIPGARPQQCWSTRPIPVNLETAFNRELDAQIAQGIIEPAQDTNDPSMWLHPMVVTRKKDPNKCRITVDLRAINKATLRPVYPAPSPWQTVATLNPASRYYTVLDGLKGYHQVPLDTPSRKLLTFVTPRGRMRYKRLPMGWHGAGDLYHERLTKALATVPRDIHARVVEDIVIHTPTGGAAHQDAVRRVLQACKEHQISINLEKVQYAQTAAKFAGFQLEGGQYRIDPDLSRALREFPRPTNRTTLRSFLGLAQQVGYFTNEITSITEPLRALNSNTASWVWTHDHEEAFIKARRTLASTTCLTPFNPARPTQLLTDASKAGLGFLLRQLGPDGIWRPTQCGSRSLAGHEANWNGAAELEALAVAWAAQKASFFLDGLAHFTILTDSSPLVAILNDRRMDQVQNDRLLKLKTAMARYNFTARHQAGERHLIADALSRAPVAAPSPPDLVLTPDEDTDRTFIVAAAVASTSGRTADGTGSPTFDADLILGPILQAAAEDPEYQTLLGLVNTGWPASRHAIPDIAAPYWRARADLTAHQGIILYGPRIVIPTAARRKALDQLHAAHQGTTKTHERARRTVWWPTIHHDVERRVAACRPCREALPSLPHQPLLHGPKATRPFQILHLDLCQFGAHHYLVITDEYSGWPDLHGLGSNTTANAVISKLRQQFLAHTVPESVRPDNGPQFAAAETKEFLALWQVRMEPSAPHLPRTNGRAEAAVKAMKKIIRGSTNEGAHQPCEDRLTEGIIAFRNTPRFGGRSPAEWVYGRNIKDTLPTHHTSFDPRWQRDWRALDEREDTTKTRAHARYDASAQTHRPLRAGEAVWVQHHITNRWTIPATIVEVHAHDIYAVKQASGRVYKRNRVHLRARQPQEEELPPEEERPTPRPKQHPPHQQTPPDNASAFNREDRQRHRLHADNAGALIQEAGDPRIRPQRERRRPARYR